ncbi:MAG: hypothetical protein JJE07_10940 [Flavobacteriaceae bacterium]|nr:hypothetical protein [Flavobacteriaceae bacterium]
MDELEILKKDWKKQDANYPKLSYAQIYNMLWKKSSSIVKWIFVISVLELFISTFLSLLFTGDDYWEQLEKYNLKQFAEVLFVIGYTITFFFIFMFYRNYKKISATDDAATLMQNILRTRRTVKYYIAYVLIYNGLTAIVVFSYMIYLHINSQDKTLTKYSFDTLDWIKFIGAGLMVLTLFLGLIWLFYRLLYGILLKKLHKNYKELKKLEM